MIHQYGKEIYKQNSIKDPKTADKLAKELITEFEAAGGQVGPVYYFKPTKRETVWEWIRCLFSPAAAKQTWLRVTDQEEERISRFAYSVLAFLIIANVGVWYAGHVRHQNAIKNAKQEIIIEQGCDMYPDICFQVEAI